MFSYQSDYIFNYRSDGVNLSKDQVIVYHYTSPEGFLGVLKDQKIRFTDIRYMNDRSEGIYFVKLLLDYIAKNKGAYPHAEDVVYSLLGENNLEDIRNLNVSSVKYRVTMMRKPHPARAFLFCTCCDSDSLNMWNYYVKNGSYQGYNIGIKVESFLKEIDKNLPKSSNVSIYYGKVLYSKKEQQNEIENLLQTLETSLTRSSESSYMKNLADWALKRYIDLYGVFYKHNKFAGEQEYRFVIEFDDDSNDIGKDLGILNADDCNIKENFCVRNGIITPFLEVPFANDTISRVYISPMTEFEIAKLSIRELIDQKEYKQTRIYQSNIPIRY